MTDDTPNKMSPELAEFLELLSGGPTPEQVEAAKQAETRGKTELTALGDDLDEDMLDLMRMVGDWGERVRDKFSLSPEAMCVLTSSFPGLHECWHSEQDERNKNRAS